MGSMRALRRQQARALAKTGAPKQAAALLVEAVQTEAKKRRQHLAAVRQEISDDVFSRLNAEQEKRFEEREEFKGRIQGEMVVLFVAFMRDRHGYGGKRIKQFVHDFNEYVDMVTGGQIYTDDIITTIREETGVDLREEFAKAEEESKAREAQ